MKTSRRHDVQPAWVLVDGVLHHVTDFAPLPPRDRPPCFCPVCGDRVTPKLGPIRVHHYAHNVVVDCPTHNSETALHLNVKLHLARQLERRLPLNIAQPCRRWPLCSNTLSTDWLAGWDEVRVEYVVGPFRPDIALLKDAAVLGAIEVLVAHPTTAGKEKYFVENEIAWVEVDADDVPYQGANKWLAETPLPFARLHPQSSDWICPDCLERQREVASRNEELERQRRYRQENYTYRHAAKMVDFYYPSGRKFRVAFFLYVEVRRGMKRMAWIELENHQPLGQVIGGIPLTEENFHELNRQVEDYINTQVHHKKAIADTVIKWRRWETGQKFVPRDTWRFPFARTWDRARKVWVEPQTATTSTAPPELDSLERYERWRATQQPEQPLSPPADRLHSVKRGEHVWGPPIKLSDGTLRCFCRRCGRDKILDLQGNTLSGPDKHCRGRLF
jgi:hypothetical protein